MCRHISPGKQVNQPTNVADKDAAPELRNSVLTPILTELCLCLN